jgi:rod shape-determining protein MreD
VKVTAAVITVVVAVILQLTLARYTVGGRWLFDLVLVGVVFAALNWGPAAGMLTGTVGGLVQDLLSDDIVGIGGLSKTIVGFATGVVASQFVVARPAPRVVILAFASLAHRMMIVGLHALVDQHWPGLPWTAMLGETGLNALCGLALFQASEGLPGAVNKGRNATRTGIRRREW